MKEIMQKKIFYFFENIFPYLLVLIPLGAVVVRGACSALTWDEAFTYIFYALPLSESPSLELLVKFSNTCHLNNHWLNTILISLFTSLFKVKYNEFIIRLPVILFALFYYLYCAKYLREKVLNWFEFILLIFSYYLNEFFGLARGYGISVSLVFFSCVFFKKFLSSLSVKDLRVMFYFLVLSTYANSCSLLIVFVFVCVVFIDLIRYGILIDFLKKNPVHIIIWGVGLFYILLFHMRASGPNMPIYKADSVDFLFYVKQYFFLAADYLMFPDSLYLYIGIVFVLMAVVSIVLLRFNRFEFILLFFLHLVMLLVIPLVFRRGGVFFRLLIPSYPLFVFCAGDVVRNFIIWASKNKYNCIILGFKVSIFVFSFFLFMIFLKRLDFLHTRDWFDNYKIKGCVMNGVIEKNGNPCWDFYEHQKENMEK